MLESRNLNHRLDNFPFNDLVDPNEDYSWFNGQKSLVLSVIEHIMKGRIPQEGDAKLVEDILSIYREMGLITIRLKVDVDPNLEEAGFWVYYDFDRHGEFISYFAIDENGIEDVGPNW